MIGTRSFPRKPEKILEPAVSIGGILYPYGLVARIHLIDVRERWMPARKLPGLTHFLGHPRQSLAGSHPQKVQEGRPTTNVEHDGAGKGCA